MTYKINIDKKAQKFIMKQQKGKRELIYKAIYNLPNGTDIKPIQGHNGYLRLRVGDYRIIYTQNDNELVICVVGAGNRGQIYNKY